MTWKHLKSRHRKEYSLLKPAQKVKGVKDCFGNKTNYTGRIPKKAKELLLDLIVSVDLPFSFMDHPKFKNALTWYAQSDDAYVPSGKTQKHEMRMSPS